MAQSSTSTRPKKTQVKTQSKALVSRLTDAGEEALQRIAELPGGQRALGAVNDLRNRVDDLAKKVRGIEELERRIARLEKQIAEQKPAKRSTASRSTPRRSSTRSTS